MVFNPNHCPPKGGGVRDIGSVAPHPGRKGGETESVRFVVFEFV